MMKFMKRFWLFKTDTKGLSRGKTALFRAWNAALFFGSAVCLGGVSLLLAYGRYSPAVFYDYFRHPLLLILNIAPVVALQTLLYALMGRSHRAFFLTGFLTMGFSIGNYYKLLLRDDPLMFQDMVNIREGLSIAKTANYDLTPDRRVVFALACFLLGTLALALFCRARPPKRLRELLALSMAGAMVCAVPAYTSEHVYDQRTVNNDHITPWSSTQVYLSKGFVYPFLHSISAGKISPPVGYRESEVAALLASYEESDIPQERKVDLITLQLEAFADLSAIEGLEGIDFEKAYDVYHAIEDESITGDLVTNVFAAGTVDTERCFLTGYANLRDYRARANSYAWYLASQGYTVEGSHPSYQWFYNRRNVNGYLGLPQYWFFENYYNTVDPDDLAADRLLLPEIASLYRQNRGDGPYFSFNVTYQGHGPYSTEQNDWGSTFTDGRFSTETTHIVDNYLSSVSDTARELRAFLDDLNTEERPVVVVGYGDHMPWMGNGNTAYAELGINIDAATEEGFYNYYSTRYFIWANDAAKAALGSDFTGEGETISSCFLMNEVFKTLGWQGNSYLQATNEVRKTLSVITTNGRFVENGALTATLSPGGEEALSRFRALEYYEMAHFRYD